MSREILALAEALASEKNVEPDVVFEALEVALGIAAKKKPTANTWIWKSAFTAKQANTAPCAVG